MRAEDRWLNPVSLHIDMLQFLITGKVSSIVRLSRGTQKFLNLEFNTNGQSLYEFTNQTNKWIKDNEFNNGIINISIQHTSASLIIQENADPDVQTDLINFFNKLVPMDNSLYIHTTEGKDDMPAHIKSALTNNQISLSVKNNELLLGTWQGLYLFEHRIEKQNRLIVLHYLGD